MDQRPDENLAQYLNDNGYGTYNQTQDNNIFIGPVRPPKVVSEVTIIPEQSIWILQLPGSEPDRVFGHAYRIHETPIQCMVRGQPNQFINTRDWAREIWEAIEGATLTNYMTCLAMQEGPVWVGYDENQRPMYSLNFAMRYQVDITA